MDVDGESAFDSARQHTKMESRGTETRSVKELTDRGLAGFGWQVEANDEAITPTSRTKSADEETLWRRAWTLAERNITLDRFLLLSQTQLHDPTKPKHPP